MKRKKLKKLVMIKLCNKILIIKLLLFFICFSFNLYAITPITLNNIEATIQYGRLTSLDKACSLARDSFFDKARRLAAGKETISFDLTNICEFSEQEPKCNLFTNSFRSIAKVQIIEYEFFKFSNGRKCRHSSLGNDIFEATVKGNVVLKKLPPPPDNINFKSSINKNQFVSYPITKKKLRKKNDDLEITIETADDMYVYIFQWWPYEDTNSIEKIFPKSFDPMNFFKSNTKHVIPTSQKQKEYRFRVDFPDDDIILDNDVTEFIMIIGTKKEVPFFDKYTYTEFGQKLSSIENFRQERKSYIIRKRTD